MTLYIYAENTELRSLLEEQLNKHRDTDSGFDIPMLPQTINVHDENVHSFSLGIRVAATNSRSETLPCLLLPRSSIYKTPFRLCNSIGLIDSGYRGDVQAKVDIWACLAYSTLTLDKGTRLFQIVQHNFLPWSNIVIVETLDALPKALDNRGDGGFGSTGLQTEIHTRT